MTALGQAVGQRATLDDSVTVGSSSGTLSAELAAAALQNGGNGGGDAAGRQKRRR